MSISPPYNKSLMDYVLSTKQNNMPMDKISTPENPLSARSATTRPRRSTIDFIRQYARAAFSAPVGAPIVLN